MTDRPADSAGIPWEGRSFTPSGFSGDDGAAPAVLQEALDRYAAGDLGVDGVVEALAAVRVLVPVVAALGEAGTSPATGLPVEKSAEMAMVTLRGKDGRVALPVFSSAAAMSAWDGAARPVPVEPRRAALSAVGEGADVLVLDVAGPVSVLVPRPAVWAVAQGRTWTPSPRDPDVLAAVDRAARAEPLVTSVRCEPGERAELRVVLSVLPGLDRGGVEALTRRVSSRLGRDGTVTERVDSVEMRITTA